MVEGSYNDLMKAMTIIKRVEKVTMEDCVKALHTCDGDIEKTVKLLEDNKCKKSS